MSMSTSGNFQELVTQFGQTFHSETTRLLQNWGGILDDKFLQERARLVAHEEEVRQKELMARRQVDEMKEQLEGMRAELREKERDLDTRADRIRQLNQELNKKSESLASNEQDTNAKLEKYMKELKGLREKVGDVERLKNFERVLNARSEELDQRERELKSQKEALNKAKVDMEQGKAGVELRKVEVEQREKTIEDKREALIRKIKSMEQREAALNERENTMDERENALVDRESLLSYQEEGMQAELQKIKETQAGLAKKERELEQRASVPVPAPPAAAAAAASPPIDVGWIGLIEYIDSLITDQSTSREDRLYLAKTRRIAQTIKELTQTNVRIRLKRNLEVEIATVEPPNTLHVMGKVHGPNPYDALKSVTTYLRNLLISKSGESKSFLLDSMSSVSGSTTGASSSRAMP